MKRYLIISGLITILFIMLILSISEAKKPEKTAKQEKVKIEQEFEKFRIVLNMAMKKNDKN